MSPRPTQELMGVYSEELVEPMAHVLNNLGIKRALVVYGQDFQHPFILLRFQIQPDTERLKAVGSTAFA